MRKKIINRLCLILVFAMILVSLMPQECKAYEKDNESVISTDVQHISSGKSIDINTELCTNKMLGVRNVAHSSGNFRRTNEETVIKNAVIVLNAPDCLYKLSLNKSEIFWEITPQIHTDILIREYIHNQDGEK